MTSSARDVRATAWARCDVLSLSMLELSFVRAKMRAFVCTFLRACVREGVLEDGRGAGADRGGKACTAAAGWLDYGRSVRQVC